MKILYLISGTNMGGATLSFLTLLDYVKQRGDDPFVIIPDNNPGFKSILKNKNIPFYVVPMTFFCYPIGKKNVHFLVQLIYTFLTEIKAQYQINRITKKIKPDLIHTNVGPLATGHFIAQRNKIPHIWHIREYGNLDFNLHFFPSRNYFIKLIGNDYSISITKDIYRYNKLQSNPKAHVVYNGVCSKNNLRNIAKREKFFLCASRISPEKNFEEIISAFSCFFKRNTDYKLIILGEGFEQYEKKIKKMCSTLECSNSIIFKGFCNNVSDYMEKATALLVASPFEGFGRMTAEACFNGCVVIGKDSGGTREILSQTGGFLYKTKEEMVQHMETIASISFKDYVLIAQKAQKKAQSLFSIEKYTSDIYSIYKNALEIKK